MMKKQFGMTPPLTCNVCYLQRQWQNVEFTHEAQDLQGFIHGVAEQLVEGSRRPEAQKLTLWEQLGRFFIYTFFSMHYSCFLCCKNKQISKKKC